MLGRLLQTFLKQPSTAVVPSELPPAVLARAPIPIFWLFGKTQSGKTSIVKHLTSAEEAVIGRGYRPTTRSTLQYDFPSADDPLLRFLDNRGLGEHGYDPDEDVAALSHQAHVVIVTTRVADHALEAIVEPLKRIRAAHPHRPVLLVPTTLHQNYLGQPHPTPDPFQDWTAEKLLAELLAGRCPEGLPLDLARNLGAQAERFQGLVDGVTPIDLTKPEDGFAEPNFGGDRLKAALVQMLPSAYRQGLLALDAALGGLRDEHERRAAPYILEASTMAATAAA
ncbi:MAG: GTPase family protein, partial [Planctomycetia bacterium]